ncbi:MAG: cysteine desulfurase family protein, partial [Methyloligellaceae bacterium]
AALINVSPKFIVFTGGGTEANMTALSPELVAANKPGSNPEDIVLFISEIEHPCVLSGGRFRSDKIRKLPVSGEGVVILSDLEEILTTFKKENPDTPFLVSVMLANNETGAIQPVPAIAELVHEHGGLLHTDAVQCAGKIAIDCQTLGADLISLSAHKTGGPQGVGALALGSGKLVIGQPVLKGGGQELNRRAGTENVAGIAGFGAAAEEAANELGAIKEIERLRDRLESELLVAAPELTIFANNIERLPNTSCIAVAGLTAETLLIALDLKGIAVSSGSACSSGKVDSSHVLKAMGVDGDLLQSAIRISLGWNSKEQDVDRFVTAWTDIYKKFRNSRAAA